MKIFEFSLCLSTLKSSSFPGDSKSSNLYRIISSHTAEPCSKVYRQKKRWLSQIRIAIRIKQHMMKLHAPLLFWWERKTQICQLEQCLLSSITIDDDSKRYQRSWISFIRRNPSIFNRKSRQSSSKLHERGKAKTINLFGNGGKKSAVDTR